MLKRKRLELVVGLLAGGLSYRKVMRLTGVSRGTIAKIKHGLLGESEREDDRIAYFDYCAQIYARCPVCGVKVKVPCLKCELERLRIAQDGRREPIGGQVDV